MCTNAAPRLGTPAPAAASINLTEPFAQAVMDVGGLPAHVHVVAGEERDVQTGGAASAAGMPRYRLSLGL